MRQIRMAAGIFGVMLAVGSQAHAQCASIPDQALADRATREVKQWEQRKQVQLTPAARSDVERDFCEAAAQLIEEGFEPKAIAKAARNPVWTYLDQMIATRRDAVSLQDLVLAEFVLGSGAALPEPKRMGVVRMTYHKAVDSLRVAGRSMQPSPLLLAETGRLAIDGLSHRQIVCRGVVTVSSVAPSSFKC